MSRRDVLNPNIRLILKNKHFFITMHILITKLFDKKLKNENENKPSEKDQSAHRNQTTT